MNEKRAREEFDTGVSKIKREIKHLLVGHGLYGSVIGVDTGAAGDIPEGSRIELCAKGRTAVRSFDRGQIEGCCLRVGGDVLAGIRSMVTEVSASPEA